MAIDEVEKFSETIVLADVLRTEEKWLRKEPLKLIKEYKELLIEVTDVIKQMEIHSRSISSLRSEHTKIKYDGCLKRYLKHSCIVSSKYL